MARFIFKEDYSKFKQGEAVRLNPALGGELIKKGIVKREISDDAAPKATKPTIGNDKKSGSKDKSKKKASSKKLNQ